jgi:LysM repeat protein
LWVIARAHGCSVDDLIGANGLDSSTVIKRGQKLKIPACSGPRRKTSKKSAPLPDMVHYVASGETLNKIAKRYDCSVDSIKKRNKLASHIIRPGQKLRIAPGRDGKGRPIAGQSIGFPHRGRLANARQLPRGRAYYRRRPYRAWGANHVVHHIQRTANIVRGKYPKSHKIAIGDVSAKTGGTLEPHKSHQSGLDVDIGFYFKKKPKGYPKSFALATKKNLDFAATFTMLYTLTQTANTRGGVTRIFLDYTLQKLLYNWALDNKKVKKRTLGKMFQYPHGPSAGHGIIRHDPGHDDHIHVRFACPRRDKKCRSRQ